MIATCGQSDTVRQTRRETHTHTLDIARNEKKKQIVLALEPFNGRRNQRLVLKMNQHKNKEAEHGAKELKINETTKKTRTYKT